MTRSNATLPLVAFIVFVDMLGVGLILPVMPRLIGSLAHVSVDRAAEIGGYLLFVYAMMQFLFAPVIGGLSDRFGRRPVLLTTLVLLGTDYLVMALAPAIGWLFAGRALSGIMGATWAASNACVADCVPADRRGRAFGLLGGAGAAGFVLGPAIGGVAGLFGARVPFLIASLLALAGAVTGFVLLRETLPRERRRPLDWSRANPLGTIIRMTRMPFVLSCLVVIFFMQLSAQAQFSIWAYWGQLRFGWSTVACGLTIALYGTLLGLVQAILTGRSVARFGAANTARFALLFALPSYLILALAGSTVLVVVAIAFGAMSGMTFPALQSLMTAHVDSDTQGELQGAIASTASLTAIIGPVVMTQVFARFARPGPMFLPGAPYLLSFILLGIAAMVLWRALIRGRIDQSAPATV